MVLVTLTLTAVISIIFGVMILIWPKLLNYLIGIYLILVGVLQSLTIYYS